MKRIAAFALLAAIATGAQAQLYGHASAGGDVQFQAGAGYKFAEPFAVEFGWSRVAMSQVLGAHEPSRNIYQDALHADVLLRLPLFDRTRVTFGGGLAYVDQTARGPYSLRGAAPVPEESSSGWTSRIVFGAEYELSKRVSLRAMAQASGNVGRATGARAFTLGAVVGF